MKSRSKRNRKRPRGGIGCFSGDGGGGDDDVCATSSLPRLEVVYLSRAFDVICGDDGRRPKRRGDGAKRDDEDRRRVRIVHPYPYTFATFAKARWIGRSVVDIYHEEFGSYPRSYYEAAIKAGRILVSGRNVECDYKVRGADELTHTVHRHEPAVALADGAVSDVDSTASGDEPSRAGPPVRIVHEDDSVLVVDKPSTLPIHPCGGYNVNSLFEILSRWHGAGKLFTVHRLDRLTSGLVLIAKSSDVASTLGKCIMGRGTGCEKVYLARVKGRFPLNLQKMDCVESNNYHPWKFQYMPPSTGNSEGEGEHDVPNKGAKRALPPCQYGELAEPNPFWKGGLRIPIINGNLNKGEKRERNTRLIAGLGYWIADGNGTIAESFQDLIDQCEATSMEEMLTRAIGSRPQNGSERIPSRKSVQWLHFSSPCRISSHKNGVCETGSFVETKDEHERKGIKPAQTSFTLLSYDVLSDTSLVVAKPLTGRTHQIRLHLQALGHPIANDHCYGGELWFGDEEGKRVSSISREWLNRLDRGASGAANGICSAADAAQIAVRNSTNADTPATDAEIYHAAANRPREDGESILDFIEKTCVWCARCRGVDGLTTSDGSVDSKLDNENAVVKRTLMEYLVRSPGIWLHALQYSLEINDIEAEECKKLCYRTPLPSWSTS